MSPPVADSFQIQTTSQGLTSRLESLHGFGNVVSGALSEPGKHHDIFLVKIMLFLNGGDKREASDREAHGADLDELRASSRTSHTITGYIGWSRSSCLIADRVRGRREPSSHRQIVSASLPMAATRTTIAQKEA